MYNGFKPETLTFLDQLGMNNSKGWFEAHKGEYLDYLKRPFYELVEALAPAIKAIDQDLETDPKHCVSRVNRDVRFTVDKSPYRTNLWLAFKRVVPDWKEEPAFFFEIFPDHYRYGMGFFLTPRPVIELIRNAAVDHEETFMALHQQYLDQKTYVLAGGKYKKPINTDVSPDLQEWTQRKEYFFIAKKPIDDMLMGPDLVGFLAEELTKLAPWYDYFKTLTEIGRVSDGLRR